MLNTGRKPVSVAPKNRKLIWKVMRLMLCTDLLNICQNK